MYPRLQAISSRRGISECLVLLSAERILEAKSIDIAIFADSITKLFIKFEFAEHVGSH